MYNNIPKLQTVGLIYLAYLVVYFHRFARDISKTQLDIRSQFRNIKRKQRSEVSLVK